MLAVTGEQKAIYMPHEPLPNTKRVKAKGKFYYYFRTGVMVNGKEVLKRLPDLKDPRFGNVYASFQAGRTRRQNTAALTTVSSLIDIYLASQDFKKLAKSSQKTYGIHLEKLRREIGNAPANDVEPRDITRLMDKMAATPGAANLVLSVTGALYRWGRRRHHVAHNVNPTIDIQPFELGEHQAWPENVLDAALAAENDRIRLAVHLLYYTAQRIGDVCEMRWSDIKDGHIKVKVTKTGLEMEIPLHERLKAELDATPKRGMTILTRWDGGPVGHQTIRKELKEFGDRYGQELVPHGIRKNAVIALLEAGCSVAETGAVSGQSFQMVEYYAKQRNQKRLSTAAILKWQGNER